MADTSSSDNEKVLYKTWCKLNRGHNKVEKADCLVTQGNVIIETSEPIKIPISHIKDCSIAGECCVPLSYIIGGKEPFCSTVTLSFLDDSDKRHQIIFDMPAKSLFPFKEALKEAK